MEEHSPNHINHVLAIAQQHQDYLGQIRHWPNIKMASEDGLVWLKDFTRKQIDSIEVKSIPYKQLYELKDNRLFPSGSALPTMKMPSLLWTPIQRGLAVELPKLNFNYFGLAGQLTISLVNTEKDKEAFALLADLKTLGQYIMQAPAIRLKDHTWVIIEPDKALVLGAPLLPIKGQAFWLQKKSLLPTGYQFELQSLADIINEKLDPENDFWLMWNADGSYLSINKKLFKPLSISSFRLSFNKGVET